MGTPNLSAALAYVAKEYPGQYEEEDTLVTVGTSPVPIVLNDPERMSLGISNVGTTDVYLRPGVPTAAANGILLLAGGGSLTLNVRDDLTLPTQAWYAYSVSAGGSVYAVSIRRFALPAPAMASGAGAGQGA